MPGKRCTVAVCNNSAIKTAGKGIIYHSFPRNSELRAIWVQKCKRDGVWNADSCSVCSVHFTDDCYERDLQAELLGYPPKKKLKLNAVPTLHLLPKSQSSVPTTESTKARAIRHLRRNRKKEVNVLLRTSSDQATKEQDNENNLSNSSVPSTTSEPLNMESLSQIQKDVLQREIDQLKEQNLALKKEVSDLKRSRVSLKRKLENRTDNTPTESKIRKTTPGEIYSIDKISELMFPILTRRQIEIIMTKKKKVVWRNEDVCRALTLRYLGKRPYMFLRDQWKMPLPAISTLQRWASKLDLRSGLLKQVIDIMKTASTKMEAKDRFVVIQFDEVKVKSCYEYDKKDDKVLGRHSQLQVVMARGLLASWKQPIYFGFDTKMSSDILFNLIRALHDASFTVVACVSDCGGGNVGLWRELSISIDKTYFLNPVTGNKIYMFADVPHLLKLIRNWLIDKGFVLNNGDIVNKEPLEALLKMDSSELKVCHNLSDIHVSCRKFQRQNVRLAAQLLSYKTAQALKYFKPGTSEKLAEDTGNFIEVIDQWFDLLNTYRINRFSIPSKSAYGLQLEKQNALLLKVDELFKTMKCCGKESLQIFQKGVLMTNASLRGLFGDLQQYLPNVKYLLTHRLNQDSLENFFSQLRVRGGFSDHPSPLEAIYRMRMIILGHNPGTLQSQANTISREEEDFIVAKVLRETEILETSSRQTTVSLEIESVSSTSSSSVRTEDRPTTSFSEDCGENGLKYLAGYIAKKFISKFAYLGEFTKPNFDCSLPAPSWIQQISYGSLVQPSDMFFTEVQRYEKVFRKFHGKKINKNKGVINVLSKKIHKKCPNLPLEIIFAFVKQRTFIRINYLNKLYKQDVRQKRLHKVVT